MRLEYQGRQTSSCSSCWPTIALTMCRSLLLRHRWRIKTPEFTDPELASRVFLQQEDFTKVSSLEKAGVHRASICIILADTSRGRSDQDADARTILAALTVEKLKPNIYTCAELYNREFRSHLQMGKVNAFVVTGATQRLPSCSCGSEPQSGGQSTYRFADLPGRQSILPSTDHARVDRQVFPESFHSSEDDVRRYSGGRL